MVPRQQRHWLVFGTVLLCLPSAVGPLRADHLTIDLEVSSGDIKKSCLSEFAGLGIKPKPRVIMEVPRNKLLTVKWTVTSKATKETLKDVTIHFFVVKEDKVGQTAVPKLDKNVPAESALTMDFKPKDKANGEMVLHIDAPGAYLLRVETIGAAVGVDGHEHFAALDLLIR